jgi:hypothetical protein
MHRQIVCAALAAVLASQARSDQINPGHYEGKAISVRQDLNGSEWTAEVELKDGTNILDTKRVNTKYHEEWTWNDRTLVKKEFGMILAGARKTVEKTVKVYHATNEGGKYRIDCKDRAAGDCDGGMEPSRYWVIVGTEAGFRCEVWGTPSGASGDPRLLFTVDYRLEK